jgi:RNA polymerase sigma factor FliA
LAGDSAKRSKVRSDRSCPTADQFNDLVLSAMDLVDRVLAEVAPKLPAHVDRAELRSAGLLGLVEASRRFDANLTVPFERYARIRIRGAMLDATRSGLLNSRRDRRRAREASAVGDDLRAHLGRPPTREEVAEAVGVDAVELAQWKGRSAVAVGLEDMGGPDTSWEEMIPDDAPRPDKQVEDRELRNLVMHAVAALPEPHGTVVRRYLIEGDRVVDLATDLGLTHGRVSQLCSEAVAALRSWLATQYDGVPPPGPAEPGVRMRTEFVSRLMTAS